MNNLIATLKPCSTYPLFSRHPSPGRGGRTSFCRHANLRHQMRFPSWESAEIISKTLIRTNLHIPPLFQPRGMKVGRFSRVSLLPFARILASLLFSLRYYPFFARILFWFLSCLCSYSLLALILSSFLYYLCSYSLLDLILSSFLSYFCSCPAFALIRFYSLFALILSSLLFSLRSYSLVVFVLSSLIS